ncbi:unnamed protein product [Paramecium octaurelia]|uniref:Uncharacterized protein n=1 Tax=Paramecium octaurelia TaxID=43137 RepID=A0A8S1U4Q8_PAROT|nr:unnamed protein product [Paramecium octaurelia]
MQQIEPQILIQRVTVYKTSFNGYVEYKYVNTQKNEKLLICFSGESNCSFNLRNQTALAKLASDVVHSTCAHNKSKKFIETRILQINDNLVMKKFIEAYIYTNFITNESKLSFQIVDIQSIYPDPQILLKQLFNLSECGSAREDLIRLIKQLIICDYAIWNLLQFNIFFGQNGQILADLFSQLSKGRGLSLKSATKYNYSFTYSFNLNNLQISHPLQELLNIDIFYDLELKSNMNFPTFILGQHLSNYKPAHGNIDHLLEQFLYKLQEGQPS